MSNTLTSVSKNLVHSFSISFVNGILNLSIWVIAPFFISPENLGVIALLLAFAMIGTTLIENSFSAGIMTFNIATVKESLPILYFNLLTLVIYIIIIFLRIPDPVIAVSTLVQGPVLTVLLPTTGTRKKPEVSCIAHKTAA